MTMKKDDPQYLLWMTYLIHNYEDCQPGDCFNCRYKDGDYCTLTSQYEDEDFSDGYIVYGYEKHE
jgi:hypothetical protein